MVIGLRAKKRTKPNLYLRASVGAKPVVTQLSVDGVIYHYASLCALIRLACTVENEDLVTSSANFWCKKLRCS